jgi:cation diffusion facilitator CzcD-associated flavoprotein CzcO
MLWRSLPLSEQRIEPFDVLIVGAGLSGIGAAYHLQTKCPRKSYVILEARDAIGGTWDLFRYPGVRSDSDMYTLGYAFRPWTDGKALADGPAILEYIRDTARVYGIDQKIRFNHKVVSATWSSADACWTVTVAGGPESKTITCRFLYLCAGYYDYDEGYTPTFPGLERFQGRIVHPQKWTNDIDYQGKRVVVIGSGATAVTLVPELAKRAAHVTMLQRTPTYIVSQPARDGMARSLGRFMPQRLAYGAARWRNVLKSMLFYQLSRRSPATVKKLIQKGVRHHLKEKYDPRHFSPPYNPWDQRLCLVPDADLFEAIKAGTVFVVTDHIETLTEYGIRLRSGTELPADLIVTATGLKLKLMGGLELTVDGRVVEPARCMVYKGMMLSDVPNLAFAVGYTNASWTLKADLSSLYVCRLLRHLDRRGYTTCVPRLRGRQREAPLIDFSSGYVRRSLDQLPKQGSRAPWKLYQNYALDLLTLRLGPLTDNMEFRKATERS